MLMTKIDKTSSMNPNTQAACNSTDRPKMSRFERFKYGIMSTVRAHPYISMACVVTGLALLVIISVGKDVGYNASVKNQPKPWDEVSCSSCAVTKPYLFMESKNPLLCFNCDCVAKDAAIYKQFSGHPEFVKHCQQDPHWKDFLKGAPSSMNS
jgi:hypothetical protein